mmetsp:Transcript_16028/g.37993  ORF Transcript_16028/g.37993 Transcript_16028/m.37993 type:complete len:352 (-) Transcript_16028:1669-2724(-)
MPTAAAAASGAQAGQVRHGGRSVGVAEARKHLGEARRCSRALPAPRAVHSPGLDRPGKGLGCLQEGARLPGRGPSLGEPFLGRRRNEPPEPLHAERGIAPAGPHIRHRSRREVAERQGEELRPRQDALPGADVADHPDQRAKGACLRVGGSGARRRGRRRPRLHLAAGSSLLEPPDDCLEELRDGALARVDVHEEVRDHRPRPPGLTRVARVPAALQRLEHPGQHHPEHYLGHELIVLVVLPRAALPHAVVEQQLVPLLVVKARPGGGVQQVPGEQLEPHVRGEQRGGAGGDVRLLVAARVLGFEGLEAPLHGHDARELIVGVLENSFRCRHDLSALAVVVLDLVLALLAR